MNHFPETTAALRRLARAIANLFKSPSQLYAEMCLKHELELLEYEYELMQKLRENNTHITTKPGWWTDGGGHVPKELVRGLHKEAGEDRKP